MSPYSEPKFYGAEYMSGDERAQFLEWYKKQKDKFDVEHIYGFVWWGFVRQVDDVTASDSRLTVTAARATPQANGFALLWKRYDNNNMAATYSTSPTVQS